MVDNKVVFVGTSSGLTSLSRYHSSLYINNNNSNVLVDCGDAVTRALLQCKIDPNSIDAIVITHLHPDHISGLGSLITQMKLTKREKPLSIYAYKDYVSTIKFFLYNQYLFINKIKFGLRFHSFDFDTQIEISENFCFIARRNSHLDDNINEGGMGAISFDSASFLFMVDNKNIFYTGDIGGEEDLYIFGDYDVEIMISEATHEEPDTIVEAFQKQGIKKLFLTHIADEDEGKIIKTVNDHPGLKIYAASDGLKLHL